MLELEAFLILSHKKKRSWQIQRLSLHISLHKQPALHASLRRRGQAGFVIHSLSSAHLTGRTRGACFRTAVTYARCTALWHPGNLPLHASETSAWKLVVIIPGGLQVLKGNTVTHLIGAEPCHFSEGKRYSRCWEASGGERLPGRAALPYAKRCADPLSSAAAFLLQSLMSSDMDR